MKTISERVNTETIVAIYVSPGVGKDGGGFVITAGGKLIKIPPYDPNFRKALAAIRTLENTEGIENVEELQAAAEHTLSSGIKELVVSHSAVRS